MMYAVCCNMSTVTSVLTCQHCVVNVVAAVRVSCLTALVQVGGCD